MEVHAIGMAGFILSVIVEKAYIKKLAARPVHE
jgi:hypothetical protein